MKILLAALLLAGCTAVNDADPSWLMRYAGAGMERAPLGKWDTTDLSFRVVGIEKVPPEQREAFLAAIERGARIWEEVKAVGMTLSPVGAGDDAEHGAGVEEQVHGEEAFMGAKAFCVFDVGDDFSGGVGCHDAGD